MLFLSLMESAPWSKLPSFLPWTTATAVWFLCFPSCFATIRSPQSQNILLKTSPFLLYTLQCVPIVLRIKPTHSAAGAASYLSHQPCCYSPVSFLFLRLTKPFIFLSFRLFSLVLSWNSPLPSLSLSSSFAFFRSQLNCHLRITFPAHSFQNGLPQFLSHITWFIFFMVFMEVM